jgi:translation initiation factor IF-1
MATTLSKFDFTKINRTPSTSRSKEYPWDQWFDGQIWKLKPGKDFDVKASALEKVIRTAANRKGKFVRVRVIDGDFVVLQASDTPNVPNANGKTPAKAAKASKTPAPAKASKAPAKKATPAKTASVKKAAPKQPPAPKPAAAVSKKVAPTTVSKKARRLTVVSA